MSAWEICWRRVKKHHLQCWKIGLSTFNITFSSSPIILHHIKYSCVYRPAVEMWFPTTNDVEPDCTPSLHPPVVLSYRPGCALFKDGIAVMADCSGAGEMSLHLHTVYREGHKYINTTAVSPLINVFLN
jgi:hypothetical protein